jgi:hypothetical protein
MLIVVICLRWKWYPDPHTIFVIPRCGGGPLGILSYGIDTKVVELSSGIDGLLVCPAALCVKFGGMGMLS